MFLSKYEHIFIVCLREHLKIWLADAAFTTLQIVTFPATFNIKFDIS